MISPTDVLVVNEGSPAHISCSIVAGSPTPQLTWSRRHQEMPASGVKELGGVLHFQEASRHHAGHYVCSADNGFGPNPVTREIKLTVHRKFSININSWFDICCLMSVYISYFFYVTSRLFDKQN